MPETFNISDVTLHLATKGALRCASSYGTMMRRRLIRKQSEEEEEDEGLFEVGVCPKVSGHTWRPN